MTYIFEETDSTTAFQLAKSTLGCSCLSSPIALSIPRIDIRMLSNEDYFEYSLHPFSLDAYCVHCRKRDSVFVPIEHLPYFSPSVISRFKRYMKNEMCPHSVNDWLVTDYIRFQHKATKHFRLIYCRKCRRVTQI